MRVLTIICFMLLASSCADESSKVDWKNVRVLIYTKNGEGYVHENIPFAVEALRKLADDKGFTADVTDDPSEFTEENLAGYNFVIFPSTNNDVFDTDEQRLAFRRYIEAGGGFVGLHSVIGTERKWDWFKKMLGGTFSWHPDYQEYTVRIVNETHPSTNGLPDEWERRDECYFMNELSSDIKVIMAQDLSTLDPKDKARVDSSAGTHNPLYPAVWYQHYDGGTIWISALGHDKGDYSDKTFVKHLLNGMAWVASNVSKPDFSKAYATSHDEQIK